MENSKLMTPLFYGNWFNRDSHRMRAVFEREVSNGANTYRLWRAAGKQDRDYPRAENDKYILQVEINGYLISLGLTDFDLIDRCGYKIAVDNLYGGQEGRKLCFDALRKSGDEEVHAALKEERVEIERCGQNPVCQADYIQNVLNEHASTYLKAKENGGETFPDFVGAAVMNDLARCQELSALYRAKRQAEEAARRARAEEEEKAYCAERNQKAEQAISAAIQVIREGGTLKNETVTFYDSRYDAHSYSVVNHLMRLYRVDVPLRTQGWINEMLSSVTIQNGKCNYYQFLRSKRGRGSEKFFECMNDLIQAVMAQPPEQAA